LKKNKNKKKKENQSKKDRRIGKEEEPKHAGFAAYRGSSPL
jgi:hypothetical protein